MSRKDFIFQFVEKLKSKYKEDRVQESCNRNKCKNLPAKCNQYVAVTAFQ